MLERWRAKKMKQQASMIPKRILPAVIWCDPEKYDVDREEHPEHKVEPKHQFEATKVYLITEEDGAELAVVICPIHNLPIPVESIRRSKTI